MSKGRKRVDEEVLREEKESERTTTRATTTARQGGRLFSHARWPKRTGSIFLRRPEGGGYREADHQKWSRLNDEPRPVGSSRKS